MHLLHPVANQYIIVHLLSRTNHIAKLLRFPHHLIFSDQKPPFCNNNRGMQGPTMSMSSTTENLAINQFPQPVRPPNSCYEDFEIPSTSYPRSSSSYVPQQSSEEVVGYAQQSNIDYSYMHVVPPTRNAKEEEGEKKVGLVDKLVNRILDKYEKLPDTIRNQVNLEEMLAKEGNREVNSESNNSRGLEQPLEGGQPERLDRFRIRTVVAGEVVTEDDNNKK